MPACHDCGANTETVTLEFPAISNQLFYTKEQLKNCYPEVDDFFAAKKKYDPSGLFSNKFYEKYAI